MNEPKRLFESGTPLERTILGFGKGEAPPDELESKVRAAMAAVPLASAAKQPAFARWLRPRAILVGVTAIGLGAVVVGSFVRRGDLAPASAPSAAAVAATPAQRAEGFPPASNADERSEVVVTPDSLPNVRTSPAAAQAPSARARSAAPAAPLPAASASIEREVELLDSVKARLGAGAVADAARALDDYDAEFPQGTLRPEATVLRIRTLLLRGDRAAAEKLGGEFLAKYPAGVHAKRIRALLSDNRDERGRSEK